MNTLDDWSILDAHNFKTHVELYNLGDLFKHYKFQTTEITSYSQNVFHRNNVNTDPIAWIQKLVEEQFSLLPSNTTLRSEADLECKAFVSTLVSFMFRIHNRLDGAVYLRKDGEDPFDVPLLLIEIHSSPSVARWRQEPIESNDKGACNCVLRNVDGEIQTWRPILFLVSLHIAMYG